jgi:hypothetical protein
MNKLVSFQDARIAEHRQINKYNTAHKENKGEKPHDVSIATEKSLMKFNIAL